jgi:hypothetical protein
MEEPTALPPAPIDSDNPPVEEEEAVPERAKRFSLADLPQSPVYRGIDLLFAVLPLWLYEILFLLTWSARGTARSIVGSNLGKIYLGLALAFAVASGIYFYLGKTKLFRRPWFSVWLSCVAYTVVFYAVFWLDLRGVTLRTDLILIPVGILLALALGLLGSSWNAELLILPWVLFSIPAVNGGPNGMLHPSSFAFLSILGLVLSSLFVILFLLTRAPLQKWIIMTVLIIAVAGLNFWAVSTVLPKYPESMQILGPEAYKQIAKSCLLTLAILILAIVPEILRSGIGSAAIDEDAL